MLRIAGYIINLIIWSQWCKVHFIVHFTVQLWFNPLRIYRRLQTLTLWALARSPL